MHRPAKRAYDASVVLPQEGEVRLAGEVSEPHSLESHRIIGLVNEDSTALSASGRGGQHLLQAGVVVPGVSPRVRLQV